MTKLMNMMAIAALATAGAAPAIAQQAADPFVSTQDRENLSGLDDEYIALISAGLIVGIALLLDDDGNVIGTTTTTTTTSSSTTTSQ